MLQSGMNAVYNASHCHIPFDSFCSGASLVRVCGRRWAKEWWKFIWQWEIGWIPYLNASFQRSWARFTPPTWPQLAPGFASLAESCCQSAWYKAQSTWLLRHMAGKTVGECGWSTAVFWHCVGTLWGFFASWHPWYRVCLELYAAKR